ncbi:hypothetical protein MTQ01_20565 [Streptomyces sp. XM4193]|uniref:hypothetical protein n=1 Tax=Streptomyces sp. XM4193 TaxID=2929782 RepID=UPI001FF7CBF0|nr:hypothetical protein [Streptomyces sp. XM4193]MCK1798375.1 hypothetical protein [Streptomyces sp. XM4193]
METTPPTTARALLSFALRAWMLVALFWLAGAELPAVCCSFAALWLTLSAFREPRA